MEIDESKTLKLCDGKPQMCPNCGYIIADFKTANFCPRCRQKLNREFANMSTRLAKQIIGTIIEKEKDEPHVVGALKIALLQFDKLEAIQEALDKTQSKYIWDNMPDDSLAWNDGGV